MGAPHPNNLLSEVRLAMVRGVGPRLRQNLTAAIGDAGTILTTPASRLATVQGIGATLAERIAAANDRIDAAAEVARAAEHGVTLLLAGDPGYPRALGEIHDPPSLLYVRGELTPADGLAVAIVGTRHATRYGLACAKRLAGELARAGLTVVSGLARGIDTAAHRGALESGGRTIAVLASGLLNPYPPENAQFALEIAEQGAVLSEAPLGMPPMSGAFPQRNRVISGLAAGVVVVEAADRSGSLITARHAAEQGREVLAVPGPIDSRPSRGCHSLIQDGAKLVTCADDVLAELGPLAHSAPDGEGGQVRNIAELRLNDLERAVLQAIEPAPTAIDDVVQRAGLPVHRVLATLSVLEMRHLVRRVSGASVARV